MDFYDIHKGLGERVAVFGNDSNSLSSLNIELMKSMGPVSSEIGNTLHPFK